MTFVRSRTAAVGSSYVLVMDEELVETRESAYPSDAEEARGRSRSDRRRETCEIPQCERCSSSFREAVPRTGQDKPGSGNGVVLPQYEVSGQIASRPRLEESGCVGTELVEQVGELLPLDGVDERIVDRRSVATHSGGQDGGESHRLQAAGVSAPEAFIACSVWSAD
jgi:hypothetical protein